MELATLFGKLQKYGIKLKKLIENEKGDEKNNTLVLKTKEKDFGYSDEK